MRILRFAAPIGWLPDDSGLFATRQRVLHSLQKSVAKFFFAARQRRDATLAGFPVARRRIKQHLA